MDVVAWSCGVRADPTVTCRWTGRFTFLRLSLLMVLLLVAGLVTMELAA
jgi:hypothetical protein